MRRKKCELLQTITMSTLEEEIAQEKGPPLERTILRIGLELSRFSENSKILGID